jgi:MoaA/NifB/PqqE/SkfB family radical SAM enzyme
MTNEGLKVYVREVELRNSLSQGVKVGPSENHPLASLAWVPAYNRNILLRGTYKDRVIYPGEDALQSELIEGEIVVGGPLRLCWSILHPCNLECPYCLDGGKSIPTPHYLLQREVVANMLSSRYLLTVDFSGGEPLLHRRLYDLLDEFRTAGVGVTLTTHGGLLAAHAERLSAYVDGVRVSIDGSNAIKHDTLRGSPGLFHSLLNGIKLLKKQGVRVRVNTVVMRPNLTDLKPIVLLARDLGAEEISLLQFLPIGLGTHKLSEYFVDTEEFIQIGTALKDSLESPTFTIRIRDLEGAAGYLTVYANGLALANADLDSEESDRRQVVIGSLAEEKLDEIWQAHCGKQLLKVDFPGHLLPRLTQPILSA